ncbi:MAG: hypothetical protein ABI467_10745 [Kofleriaceae bacterium]
MSCLALVFAIVLAACGTPDSRPATVEVVALEILAPSCGQVQCHSTTTNQSGYAFDTLAAAKVSLRSLVGTGGGDRHSLLEVLTSTGDKRMPPDAPLDDDDIALVEAWIHAGAQGL